MAEENITEGSPRFELRLLDSGSRVLTVTPRNQVVSICNYNDLYIRLGRVLLP